MSTVHALFGIVRRMAGANGARRGLHQVSLDERASARPMAGANGASTRAAAMQCSCPMLVLRHLVSPSVDPRARVDSQASREPEAREA